MDSSYIRNTFLKFYQDRGHAVVESAPLVPIDDPTLLFTNAGMVPFKEVFIGNSSRDYQRATSCQRCVRAGGKHNDLEQVGYTARHLTLFEMLGNFSFGDYFKDEAIAFAWELVTKEFNLDQKRLYISVYEEDDEAYSIWRKIGLSADRIFRFGAKDNFWAMGDTGPCGPCSELFYDMGVEAGSGPEDVMGGEGDRFLEFYNLVFMQYEARSDGTRAALPRPSIDTGMGLERISAILGGKLSNFETDLFTELLEEVWQHIGNTKLNEKERKIAAQVISDHARTATFLIADGVLPSNLGRGYVLRRIMRRAIRYSYQLGINKPFMHRLVPIVIKKMQAAHGVLTGKETIVADHVALEEESFLRTVHKGLDLLDKAVDQMTDTEQQTLPGEVCFKLYDTFGFPKDLTEVILKEKGLKFDATGFDQLMEEQRLRARASQKFGIQDDWDYSIHSQGRSDHFIGYEQMESEGKILKSALGPDGIHSKIIIDPTPFYAESGGQVGDRGRLSNAFMQLEVIDTQKEEGEIVHHCRLLEGNYRFDHPVLAQVDVKKRFYTRKNHTAVHLLQGVLIEMFGSSIQQAGSYVDWDRFRFDFTHNRALSREELLHVEAELFERIHMGKKVNVHHKSLEDARKMGALCPFGEKYGDEVRVIQIPEFSMEFCGGTHVDDIAEIGMIKILSESSIAAGVRRIEGVVSKKAFGLFQEEDETLREVQGVLNTRENLGETIRALQIELKKRDKELTSLRLSGSERDLDQALQNVLLEGSLPFITSRFTGLDAKSFRLLSDKAMQKLGSGLIVLFNQEGDKAQLISKVSQDWVNRGIDASVVVQGLAPLIGGRGGGRKNMAQAGGDDPAKISQALAQVPGLIRKSFQDSLKN